MAQSSDNALSSTRDATLNLNRRASSSTDSQSQMTNVRPAKITAVLSGVYTVGILGSDSSVVETIPGVRPHDPNASFNVNDRVMLVWIGIRPIPFIIASGASAISTTGQPILIGAPGWLSGT